MPTPAKGTSQGKRRRAEGVEEGRAVVTLTPPVAAAAKRMGKELGEVSTAEVVRRGLILLDLMLSLTEDEELVVRSKSTEQIERLRFAWETF